MFEGSTYEEILPKLPTICFIFWLLLRSNCGAPLIDSPIIVPHDQNISVTGHTVTSRQLKQMGVSVAVSVLALLAEVSLIYLQRRLDPLPVKQRYRLYQPKKFAAYQTG